MIPSTDGERWLISKGDAADLATYEAEQIAWMRAASACLAVKP